MTPGIVIACYAELQADLSVALTTSFPGVGFVTFDDSNWERLLPQADAVISWNLSSAQLAAASRLRWIQTIGAGVESFPLAEIASRQIVLTNASGVHAINIAEHLMAMMLAFARNLPAFYASQQRHEWLHQGGRQGIFELHGQHLVVVGLGQIGSSLAERAAAFGMKVTGVRRHLNTPAPAAVSTVCDLAMMPVVLGSADQVAITLPLTPETRGFFGAEIISAIKPGAYLYNIGRGATVDTDALLAALRSGHLAGAGLDVVDPEPLPPDHPLWSEPNVILTPHLAGFTPRYSERIQEIVAANIELFLRGSRPLRNEVDLIAGY